MAFEAIMSAQFHHPGGGASLPASALGADEGIERRDSVSPGYRDRVELRGRMSDLGGVARLPEDLEDVRRVVGEEVARIGVSPIPHSVYGAASVRMDQPPKELARVEANDPALPVLQHDGAMMFPARSMLRKEAGPVLPRCTDLVASGSG